MVVRDPNSWTPDPFKRSWRWELRSTGFILHLELPPHPAPSRWWLTCDTLGDIHMSTPLDAANDLDAVVCVSCLAMALTYQDMAWTG